MEAAELGAWLRLALTPGLGNIASRKLLTVFGSVVLTVEVTSYSLPRKLITPPYPPSRKLKPGPA